MERQALITKNMGFAYYMANKFKSTGVELEELQSVALFGLVKAADVYDPDKGLKFSTLAGTVIQNEILMFLRSERKHKRITCSLQDETVEGHTLEEIMPDPYYFEDVVEQKLRVQELVGKMNPKEKNIFNLYFVEGMKQNQIGQALGYSQAYISRIIKRFRERERGKLCSLFLMILRNWRSFVNVWVSGRRKYL